MPGAKGTCCHLGAGTVLHLQCLPCPAAVRSVTLPLSAAPAGACPGPFVPSAAHLPSRGSVSGSLTLRGLEVPSLDVFTAGRSAGKGLQPQAGKDPRQTAQALPFAQDHAVNSNLACADEMAPATCYPYLRLMPHKLASSKVLLPKTFARVGRFLQGSKTVGGFSQLPD